MSEDGETIREAALAEKVDQLTRLILGLADRVTALEQKVMPQDPDPELGLP